MKQNQAAPSPVYAQIIQEAGAARARAIKQAVRSVVKTLQNRRFPGHREGT